MSCGNPHDTDCAEVLARVYEYLDGELDEESLAAITHHLDECSPCLAEFGLERVVREVVQRSCRCSAAPEALRMSILSRISQITGTARAE